MDRMTAEDSARELQEATLVLLHLIRSIAMTARQTRDEAIMAQAALCRESAPGGGG